MTDNNVTIRASTKHEEHEEKGGYHRREMSRGEFQRTVSLPVEVKGEEAKASFKDGILELVFQGQTRIPPRGRETQGLMEARAHGRRWA